MNLSSLSSALGLSVAAAGSAGWSAYLASSAGLSTVPSLISVIAAGLAVAMILVSRSTIRRVTDVCDSASRGDFEPRALHGREGGELRTLILSVNRMIDVSDGFVRESMATLAHAGEGKYYRKILPSGFQGSFLRASRIINQGMDDVRANIHAQMEQACSKLMTSADVATRQATTLDRSVADTAQAVNQVAAAVEELSASISEINQHTRDSTRLAQSADERVHAIDQVLSDLIRSEERIFGILSMIAGVTEKTNLLALNATIEAARAGESGKGFAVVAHEVKMLAGQTSSATAEISSSIEATRHQINNTVASVRGIGDLVTQLSQSAQRIEVTIQEQLVATRDIAQSVTRAASNANEIAQAAKNVADAANYTEAAARDTFRSIGKVV